MAGGLEERPRETMIIQFRESAALRNALTFDPTAAIRYYPTSLYLIHINGK